MSKKRDEFIAESLEYFQGIAQEHVTYYQKQPYTMCMIASTIGFSKVCFPDRWDAERGKELALLKVISENWKQRKED